MSSKVINITQKKDGPCLPKLQEILNGLPQAIAVFDQNLLLIHWNQRLISLFETDDFFLNDAVHLKDILHINWYEQHNERENLFATSIVKELSKAQTSDDLYPFSYEYHLKADKIIEIKGEVMPNLGLALIFSDISLRMNSNYPLQAASISHSQDTNDLEIMLRIEAQSNREIIEMQASKAIQIAEDLAITREIAENTTRRMEAILNAISEVLVTTDLLGDIMSCNRAAKNIFGYASDEVIGKNLLSLINTKHITSTSNMQVFFTALDKDEQLKKQSGTGHKKDGSTFPVELTIREVIMSGEKQFTIVISDVTERHEAELLIRKMAHHDSLTGLANRNLLQQKLDDAIHSANRSNKKIAMMFLDLDGFKQVNDLYGHATGDKLLQIVSERLEKCARKIDTIARIGGDEFAIISTNIEAEIDIVKIAERILHSIREPIIIKGNTHQIAISIGISFFPLDTINPEELFRMADVALYQAKNDGKDSYRLYNPKMDSQAKEERQIEVDLEKAIKNDELILHYQPLLNTLDESIVGAEALVRWQHPKKGIIPPYAFIPIAENSELILRLGQKILEMACIQANKWHDMGLPDFRVCVNISARQFQSKDFIDNVKHALELSGVRPARLELEITEGMVIGDIEAVTKKLHILADMGITLAIDDFGTGYSSLAYLKRFPVHQLKIDQSFIRDIAEDYDDAAITDAVIQLGHSLGLTVVAEGVETAEQARILRQKKCDVLQGYFFSRPIPADEFEQWVETHMVKSETL